MSLIDNREEMTYAEYLKWDEGKRCEVLDGQVISMTPARTPDHQRVLRELAVEFAMYLRGKECETFTSPIDVCLFDKKKTDINKIKNWVQPDLIVVCDENKIDNKRIIGPPDLAAEILSPSTAKNDRILKFNKYEEAGIKEYWIVDPYNQVIEVYLLEDGTYQRQGMFFRKDVIKVNILSDLEIDLKNVFLIEAEEEYEDKV
ncbi:Uma2 family endonuclease [Scopulibacillus cellulosilyticus]|uniref:Uma2 family endonuclease n=1 Tax=Scopulibacillus cellulosilyticus TaxID=2665665 RepID=A0ABW2PQZ8_9BACL